MINRQIDNADEKNIFDYFLLAASGAFRDAGNIWPRINQYFKNVAALNEEKYMRPVEDDDKTVVEKVIIKIRRASENLLLKDIINRSIDSYFKFAARLEKELGRSATGIISIFDENYPPLLREISAPPPVIFTAGLCFDPLSNNFAVVGTRKPSVYSLSLCEKITPHLIRNGFTIISGMAAGIDSCAHLCALNGGGHTYAVLAGGFDVIYPPQNQALYLQILSSGAVISEYLPGQNVRRQTFVYRNRIITGLSKAVFVCGAGIGSGAIISAKYAFEQSREVFTVAGDVYRADMKGCHELIKKNYAKLVLNEADILFELYGGPDNNVFSSKFKSVSKNGVKKGVKNDENCDKTIELKFEPRITAVEILNSDEKKVVSLIELLSVKYDAPPSVELMSEYAAAEGMKISRLLAAISALELKGVITELDEKRYEINK